MLTVLLATRAGGATLARTLDAHRRLVSPAGGWRLVVVVNGAGAGDGDDATRAVLAAAARDLPLVAVGEPVPGQNRARNRGAAHVVGDLLVLTDDDTLPRADWLVALRTAADAHPAHDVVVGTVRPRFEVEPAPWLRAAVRAGPTWACVERAVDGEVDPTEGVSPNVAIRVAALPAPPWFDPTLGPDGSAAYPMGSETALLLRLAAAGARAWYTRTAVVEHVIPAAHVEPAWILARALRYGRGRFRLGTIGAARARLHLGGVPLRVWADALGRRLALARARDPARRFKVRWKLAFLAGQAVEARVARGLGSGVGALRHVLPRDLRELLAHAGAMPGVATPVAPAGAAASN